MKRVEIYTDGSSKGNPGPGGFGSLLRYETSSGTLHEREISQGFRNTTNNRMELLGVITALEALSSPCEVTVYTDSQYVANAFNQRWIEGWIKRGWRKADKAPVLNVDLWQRLLKAMESHDVAFVWVKGHAGNSENERCDKLATSAAEGEALIDDVGYGENGQAKLC